MKAKETTNAVTTAVTKDGTKAVIVVMEGEEDAEVGVLMRVANRQEEEVVTRIDTRVANISTPMKIVFIPVSSARLRVRSTR